MGPNKFILYHESIHFLMSSAVAFLIWKIYPSPLVFIFSIFAGVVIDADHLFDLIFGYLKIKGRNFSTSKLVTFFYNDYMSAAGKVYVILHSLEFIWVWWLIGRYLNPVFDVKGLEIALTFPLLIHILMDYAAYMPHPLAYFLFYRLWHKFGQDSYHGKQKLSKTRTKLV